MFNGSKLRLEIFDFNLICLCGFSLLLYSEVEAVVLFLLFINTLCLLIYCLAAAQEVRLELVKFNIVLKDGVSTGLKRQPLAHNILLSFPPRELVRGLLVSFAEHYIGHSDFAAALREFLSGLVWGCECWELGHRVL